MKRRISSGVIAAAVTVVIIVLLFYARAPLLYAESDHSVTPFHTSTNVLGPGKQEDAAAVMPLMGDLLSQHGSLTLNVRSGDFDLAARDLREFVAMGGRLDSLVINLDMSESEIEDWRRLNRDDISLLSELVNSTTALDQLRRLEVRYRAEGNNEELYAVTVQGETLQRRLQQLYGEYRANKESMIRISGNYELNTTPYEQSVDDFEAIVRQFAREQETREYLFIPGSVLSLQVLPNTSVYHDALDFSGTLEGPDAAGREVRIFIDAKEAFSVATGTDGRFRAGYFIERIRTGEHTAYAQSGQSTFSNPVTFTVRELETSITMTPDPDGRQVACEGGLTAGRIPVTGAPVEIQADGATVGRVVTDDQGRYRTTVTLAPGKYLVRSWFSAQGYPLTEAWSPAVPLTITPAAGYGGVAGAGIMPLIAVVLITGVSIAAASWYLLRKNRAFGPVEPSSGLPVLTRPADLPGPAPESAPLTRDQAIAAYQAGISEDAGTAVRHLFLYLVARCQERLGLRNAATLTPRELCRETRSRPFFTAFRAFITGYEPIRYGGRTEAGEAARDAILTQFTAVSDAIEGDRQ